MSTCCQMGASQIPRPTTPGERLIHRRLASRLTVVRFRIGTAIACHALLVLGFGLTDIHDDFKNSVDDFEREPPVMDGSIKEAFSVLFRTLLGMRSSDEYAPWRLSIAAIESSVLALTRTAHGRDTMQVRHQACMVKIQV
jgi:hypothetical protein